MSIARRKAARMSHTRVAAHLAWLFSSAHLAAVGEAMPNTSLKLSANGVAHWPSGAGPAAHFAPAVQCTTPLAPA